MSNLAPIKSHLSRVYTEEESSWIAVQIDKLWKKYGTEMPAIGELSERDVALITYGDQVYQGHNPKLETLHDFLDKHLSGLVSLVHILPFYPYSSDDGFSVIDYYQVRHDLGDWDTITRFSSSFRLMFDAVINHMSAESAWFQAYLDDDPAYKDFFVDGSQFEHLENVLRPRTSPLVHDFNGKYVWTTFSRDQVDLNYENPRVLVQILDLLLFYASKGAAAIRLDAIGFMWKEEGTTCMHLPQTHEVIKVCRQVLEGVCPQLVLITETNVPHVENISYFGDGDEAHMVYNFTLPPLMAFSILSGATQKLQTWARGLKDFPDGTCFFNFLASHDGVGVRPVADILETDELQVLLEAATHAGGRISYRNTSEGQMPYEINCNYLSLLGAADGVEKAIERSILAHSILLAFPGLPAVYFHSMFGCQNDLRGLETLGYNRAINREKFAVSDLQSQLNIRDSVNSRVHGALKHLMEIRQRYTHFHPLGPYGFPRMPDSIFAIERHASDDPRVMTAYCNLSDSPAEITLTSKGVDVLSGVSYVDLLPLAPYGFAWLLEDHDKI